MIAKPQHQRTALDQAIRHEYGLEIGCTNRTERRRALRKAAERGDPTKMHELALACADRADREHWLREAAYEDYVPAM